MEVGEDALAGLLSMRQIMYRGMCVEFASSWPLLTLYQWKCNMLHISTNGECRCRGFARRCQVGAGHQEALSCLPGAVRDCVCSFLILRFSVSRAKAIRRSRHGSCRLIALIFVLILKITCMSGTHLSCHSTLFSTSILPCMQHGSISL